MNSTAIRTTIATSTAVIATVATLAATADRSASADPPVRPYCSLGGLTVHEWDGAGDGTSWSDPDNWVGGTVPADDLEDTYVCIPGGSTVVLAEGEVATIAAIDTEITSTLTLEAGAGLFVYGDPATQASYVGGELVSAGSLGGPGTIHDLDDTALPFYVGSVVLSPGAVLRSDPCPAFPDLPAAACSTADGRLVSHGGGGISSIEGFRMLDGYDVVVGNLVFGTEDGTGGIAMSPGSRLVVRPAGQVTIFGEADVYPVGPDRTGPTRPVLVNRGTIERLRLLFPPPGEEEPSTDGGITVISTAYRGLGEVRVMEGTQVIISGGSTRPVAVTALSRFGSGPCRLVQDDCRLTTRNRPGSRQAAVLQAPSSQSPEQHALVEVRRRPDLRRPGDIGVPYYVHADELEATPATPAILELRFDRSLLGGRTWRDVQVFRQRIYQVPWRRIPACRANGRPPADAKACVDRRGLPRSSRQAPGGDAILVVRTTVTSRWVGH